MPGLSAQVDVKSVPQRIHPSIRPTGSSYLDFVPDEVPYCLLLNKTRTPTHREVSLMASESLPMPMADGGADGE